MEMEVLSIVDRCIGCSECIHGCPQSALSIHNGNVQRNSSRCLTCLNCIEICPTLTHLAIGDHWDIDSIMAEIENNLSFHSKEKKSVTFSGGEPLMQPEALLTLLQHCGRLGIHRTVITTGFAPSKTILEVAEHTDLFLCDLRHMDGALHREHTGVSNRPILDNLQRLAKNGSAIRIRIPLIAGVNDSNENITATAQFANTLPSLLGIDIWPIHLPKKAHHAKLQIDYKTEPHSSPDADNYIFRIRALLEKYGHKVNPEG